MGTGTKVVGDSGQYYVWQAPGAAFSIQLSLHVVEKLTAEHKRSSEKPLSDLNGFLVGRSVAAPRSPALYVEDVVLVPAGKIGTRDDSTAFDDSLTDRVWELVREGRQIIGSFRSLSDGPLAPNVRDMLHVGRLSPEAAAVLLIRFRAEAESEAVFFYWESGAADSHQSALFPFSVEKLAAVSRVVKEADIRPVHRDPPPPAPRAAITKGPVSWLRLSPTILLFTVATLVTQMLSRPTQAPATQVSTPVETALGLKVISQQNQLEIHWRDDAPQIRSAEKATLRISEGDTMEEIRLDRSDLREGYVVYTPTTKDVALRLEVSGPGGSLTAESLRAIR